MEIHEQLQSLIAINKSNFQSNFCEIREKVVFITNCFRDHVGVVLSCLLLIQQFLVMIHQRMHSFDVIRKTWLCSHASSTIHNNNFTVILYREQYFIESSLILVIVSIIIAHHC